MRNLKNCFCFGGVPFLSTVPVDSFTCSCQFQFKHRTYSIIFFLQTFSAGKNFDGHSHSCLVFCINIIMHFGEKVNFTWLYELIEEEAREKKRKEKLKHHKTCQWSKGNENNNTTHTFLLFIYSLFFIITAQCSQNIILYLNKEHKHPYQFITV